MKNFKTYITEALRIKSGVKNVAVQKYSEEQLEQIFDLIVEYYKGIFHGIRQGKIEHWVNPIHKMQVKIFNEAYPEKIRNIMTKEKPDERGMIKYTLQLKDLFYKLDLTHIEVCEFLSGVVMDEPEPELIKKLKAIK